MCQHIFIISLRVIKHYFQIILYLQLIGLIICYIFRNVIHSVKQIRHHTYVPNNYKSLFQKDKKNSKVHQKAKNNTELENI